MTVFLRLLSEKDKGAALEQSCARVRHGVDEARCIYVDPRAFDAVPGKPFSYWVSDAVRQTFVHVGPLSRDGRSAYLGGSTKSDFRFLRLSWEGNPRGWLPFAKGGAFSRFYADIYCPELKIH